jgi:transposase-like protein
MKKAETAIGRKGQKGRNFKYDLSFRRKVVQDYLVGNESLRQLAARYGISHHNIYQWRKEFSCELGEATIIEVMTEQEQRELEALKKQNQLLKEKLEYEQMRTFALETMIDLAKEKLGVDVRKNFGAKQPEE